MAILRRWQHPQRLCCYSKVVLGPDYSTVSTPPPSGSPVSVHVSHGSTSTPTHLPEDLTVTNAADTTCE